MAAGWQLQDAKNRFSQVVDRALSEGPQTVTRRGEPVVVVVALDTWRRLSGERPSPKDYLATGDLQGLDLSRDAGERSSVELP